MEVVIDIFKNKMTAAAIGIVGFEQLAINNFQVI